VQRSPRPESNRRPPDSKSGVPRQRRLRGCTSLSLSLCRYVPGVPDALSAHGTARSPRCPERTEVKPPRASSTAPAHRCWTERSLDECRRQSRVPSPRTGSPCGGQVMRVWVSGYRRSASHSRVRRRAGDSRPGPSHADLVGTRRPREPRLRVNEQAANWGEYPS